VTAAPARDLEASDWDLVTPYGLERFYLGCPEPSWLADDGVGWRDRAQGLAMFVQHRRLARLQTLPVAKLAWAADSGAFNELRIAGQWRTTPADYVRAVARYDQQIGMLEWAAPQDWPCEPGVRVRTGLSTWEHQRRTVDNYLQLRQLWPMHSDDSCPFMPVIQGSSIQDYHDCVALYSSTGLRGRADRRTRVGLPTSTRPGDSHHQGAGRAGHPHTWLRHQPYSAAVLRRTAGQR
jgi:hypothetical protein